MDRRDEDCKKGYYYRVPVEDAVETILGSFGMTSSQVSLKEA